MAELEIFLNVECKHCGDILEVEFKSYIDTVIVTPCTCQNAISEDKAEEAKEAGREEGYKEGYNDGLETGEENGYHNGYNDAQEKYEEEVRQ